MLPSPSARSPLSRRHAGRGSARPGRRSEAARVARGSPASLAAPPPVRRGEARRGVAAAPRPSTRAAPLRCRRDPPAGAASYLRPRQRSAPTTGSDPERRAPNYASRRAARRRPALPAWAGAAGGGEVLRRVSRLQSSPLQVLRRCGAVRFDILFTAMQNCSVVSTSKAQAGALASSVSACLGYVQ